MLDSLCILLAHARTNARQTPSGVVRSSILQDRTSFENQQEQTTSAIDQSPRLDQVSTLFSLIDRLTNPLLLDKDDCMMMETDSPFGMIETRESFYMCFWNLSLLVRLQSATESQTSLIRSLKEEVAKLTKKMGRFSSVLSSVRTESCVACHQIGHYLITMILFSFQKNEQLSLYQDPNDKENYLDEIVSVLDP